MFVGAVWVAGGVCGGDFGKGGVCGSNKGNGWYLRCWERWCLLSWCEVCIWEVHSTV